MNPSQRVPDPADLMRAALPGAEGAAPWSPPPLADLAAAFPELVVHELIGQGGMAAVYRATQTRLDRVVALKVMRPDLAKEPQFAERFVREARALAALSNQHVLAIHDFGQRAGFCYLVTEFVDGANLRELMQLGRLSPAEVLRLVPQICAALHFAHQHGVVHRDIKPENVLVDRAGHVKLADFGLAKLAGHVGVPTFTRSGEVFGTPHYMAPEQWHGSAGVDHRADIYALGVLLYELLTGRLPVGTYAPASKQPGVPPGIDPIVQRSLQHEPAERYQSARDVQMDLERQSAATGASVAPALPAAGHAGRWLAAAIAVLFFGIVAIGWFVELESLRERASRTLREYDEHNAALTAEIAATVRRGEPWVGEIPRPAPPMPRGPIAAAAITTVALCGGLGTLLATALLATVARRRTRAPGTSRGVHIAAGLVMAAPAVVAVVMTERWFDVLESPLLALGLATVVIVLLMLWHTSSRRSRAPAEIGPVGWPTRVGLGICALLGVYCAYVVVLGPRQPPCVPTARLPASADELIGISREELLARLGPPLHVTSATGSMYWNYLRLDASGQDAVQIANGVVVGIARDGRPPVRLLPEPIPAHRAFPGQTVQELVSALGPVTSSSESTIATELVFADGTTASVNRDGIVVRVGR